MKNIFSQAYLTEEFELAGECLETDLTAVNLYLSKDVQNDDFELEVFIFGKDGPNSAPIINHFIDIEELLNQQAGNAETFPSIGIVEMFDSYIRKLLAKKDIKIMWNHGLQTEAAIDPLFPEKTDHLSVEAR